MSHVSHLPGIFNLPWKKTCQCRVIGGVRKVARTLAERANKVHLGVSISSVELGDDKKQPCINFENKKGEKTVRDKNIRILI